MSKKRGGRPKKDKFADLDESFKAEVQGASADALKDIVARITLSNAAIQAEKEDDQDLREKQAAATAAGAIYREAAKAHKTKLAFVRETMKSRGMDA